MINTINNNVSSDSKKSKVLESIEKKKENINLSEIIKKYENLNDFINFINKGNKFLNKKFFMKVVLNDTRPYEIKLKEANNRIKSAKSQIGKDKAKIEGRGTIKGMSVKVLEPSVFLERIKKNEDIIETWENYIKFINDRKEWEKIMLK